MPTRAFDAESALSDDRWIRRLAGSLVQDGADADDALQEARLALVRTPPRRIEDPRPWLAKVAINFLRRRRREERRRERRERRAARPERLFASPEDALEKVELRRRLLEAVLALDEPYRTTLVLRFFEELRLKDIAAAAGVPLNTVKTRLSRALGILRRRLELQYGAKGAWAAILVSLTAANDASASAGDPEGAPEATAENAQTTGAPPAEAMPPFVGDPRPAYAEEIREALAAESDLGIRKQYSEALRMIEDAGAARSN
jgi:RNA polymerase sigma-70 factor (ECF subfamily)